MSPSHSNHKDTISVIIEDTAGKQYGINLPITAKLNEVCNEFFVDAYGSSFDDNLRAVAELIDPNNPNISKRLDSNKTIKELGLYDDAVLRVFPESIAGAIDEHKRITALIAAHKQMEALKRTNSKIDFTPNMSQAPTRYTIVFHEKGICGLKEDGHTPIILDHHELEIKLGPNYPGEAPSVRWITPIFHPNIRPKTGDVCLGVLREKYLPGLGLAKLVVMLFEMLQYRNYDIDNPFNPKAAAWAEKEAHQTFITEIGGYTYQDPVAKLLDKIDKLSRTRQYEFKPIKRHSK